jgi:hypothetical protein
MDYERDFEYTDDDARTLEASVERMKTWPRDERWSAQDRAAWLIVDWRNADPTLAIFHEPRDSEQGDG